MPTAENAKLEYEGGQNAVAMSELTDSGDRTTFNSSASLWSRRSGFAPVVRPNGVLTGGAVTPAAGGGNDNVDVAALSCNLNGVVTSVAADADVSITRPASNVAKVCSITIDNAGSVAVVQGTNGATTAFSETRGAAGGPPLIPADSIEIGQVRVTTSAAAPIAASEVFTTPGLHVEQAINPNFTIDYAMGKVIFLSALPAIHASNTPKKVFASYASPIFAEVPEATDFVTPETAHTINSTQIYGKVKGSSSATLNAGSFTAFLEDGVTDPLVALKNEQLWFRFYPDRYASANIKVQGKLGITRRFPADDNIQTDCTISAESDSIEAS